MKNSSLRLDSHWNLLMLNPKREQEKFTPRIYIVYLDWENLMLRVEEDLFANISPT